MREDALKWDKRHSEGFMPTEPSEFLKHHAALIQAFLTALQHTLDSENSESSLESSPKFASESTPKSTRPLALDLACGNGRNSRFLASLGFGLESVDISHIALESLRDTPHITPILADLDSFKLPASRYHLFLQSFFLDRRLFEDIIASLRSPALLLFETFVALESVPSTLKNESPNRILDEHELSGTFSSGMGFHTISSSTYLLERHNGSSEHVQRFITLFAPLDSEKSQAFQNLAQNLRAFVNFTLAQSI